MLRVLGLHKEETGSHTHKGQARPGPLSDQMKVRHNPRAQGCLRRPD